MNEMEIKPRCSNCGSIFSVEKKQIHIGLPDNWWKNKTSDELTNDDFFDMACCPCCKKDVIIRPHLFEDGKEYQRNKNIFIDSMMLFKDGCPNPNFGKTSVTLFKKKMEFITLGFISEFKRFKNRRSTRNYTWMAKTIIDSKNNIENILDVRR